ncbi:MAG: general secretion pathway protein GspB [Pseudomonadota bacterium]|jgi:general secretion pathway protein B
MSFILDALRKSEHERDRRILPGLVDAPRAQRVRPQLAWIIGLIAALFVVNCGALLYLFVRDAHHASTPIAAPAQITGATFTTASPPSAVRSVPRPARSLADEASVGTSTAPYSDVPATPRTRPVTPPATTTVIPAHPLMDASTNTAGLPTRRQLPAAVASALPSVSIDLHVYSAEPAQRFMVVSGQRVQEGATVAGGILIEKITPEGAIAVFKGTRFLLTRE